jgi:hypothetical protein
VGDGGVASSNAVHASNWPKPIDSAIENHSRGREQLPFEIVFATVRIIQVHEQTVFVYVLALSNYSTRCLELDRPDE